MQHLSDKLLLESYHRALQLNLSKDFIQLLLIEIRKRKLNTLFELSKVQKEVSL